MLRANGTSCCGVGEFEGIQEYGEKVDDLLLHMCDHVMRNKRVYYMYSANNTSDVGDKITSLIRQNNMGVVTAFDEKHNLNSGNKIKVYMWDVDREVVQAWHDNQTFKLYKKGDRVSVPYGWGDVLTNGVVCVDQNYITEPVSIRLDKFRSIYDFRSEEVQSPV